jgi:uncharacterized membrane protein YGL010W
MPRTTTEWFGLYSASHQNKINKAIHFACVPVIYYSLLGLISCVPTPAFFPAHIDWAVLSLIVIMPFYARLSWSLLLGMLLFSALCLMLRGLASSDVALFLSSLVLFIAAWIGQFIGHAVEGKKPSFFQDLQFLLVGPAWILGFIYRRAGLM